MCVFGGGAHTWSRDICVVTSSLVHVLVYKIVLVLLLTQFDTVGAEDAGCVTQSVTVSSLP